MWWLAACGLFPGNSVTVYNDSSQRMEDVVVVVAEREIWQGSLESGASHRVSYGQQRDGSFDVTGTLADGREIRAVRLGYTTSGAGIAHGLHLREDGAVDYRLE